MTAFVGDNKHFVEPNNTPIPDTLNGRYSYLDMNGTTISAVSVSGYGNTVDFNFATTQTGTVSGPHEKLEFHGGSHDTANITASARAAVLFVDSGAQLTINQAAGSNLGASKYGDPGLVISLNPASTAGPIDVIFNGWQHRDLLTVSSYGVTHANWAQHLSVDAAGTGVLFQATGVKIDFTHVSMHDIANVQGAHLI